MPVETIDDVVDALDALVDEARRTGRRDGYFAALYRGVTARVRDDVRAGRFDDAARMERLDVLFARRYLDAHAAYHGGGACSAAWRVAFDAAGRWPPVILQHLLLGMNAHINLDLGIAAAQTVPADELADLRGDFMAINAILLDLLDDVQDRLGALSPWFAVLDVAGGGLDEVVARCGLRGARDDAWRAACRLAPLAEADRAAAVDALDRRTAALARLLYRPGPLLTAKLWIARLAERRPPADVIDALLER